MPDETELLETRSTPPATQVTARVTTPEAGEPPVETVIRPTAGWQIVNLREVWHYSDLLWTLGERDIRLRYRQTALGVVWVILQPLMGAFIFAFVFGRVAKLPSNGLPYLLISYAGLLGWNAFQGTLTKASGCLVQNERLVSKVYFPRLVLPLSTVFSTLVDFGVALGLMAVLLALYRITLHAGVLLLPVWLGLLLLLALGLGLFAAALMVSYRDVQYVIPVLTQFLLYASPVAYAVSALPARLHALFRVNPLTGLLEAFRWSLLGQGGLDGRAVAWSAACAVAVFLAGAMAFKRLERRFADVI